MIELFDRTLRDVGEIWNKLFTITTVTVFLDGSFSTAPHFRWTNSREERAKKNISSVIK